MNIVYIAMARIPTEKAHGLQIMSTCDAFSRAGDSVELLLPRRRNAIRENAFSYYGIAERFTVRTLPALHFTGVGRTGFVISTASFLIPVSMFVVRHKKSRVFYTRDIFIAAAVSALGARVVFEDHEPMKNRFLYRLLLSRIPHRVVVAPALAILYKTMGVSGIPPLVAPNGVDVASISSVQPDQTIWERTLGIPFGSRIVLYLGHFYPWKGVYTLVESARFLPANVAVVCIGGTKEDERELREYLRQQRITRVWVHPFVPHLEAIRFLRSASVAVLPNSAREERSLRYTTPLKLFEYLAAGVPIVASDIPSFSSFLTEGRNAVLVKPDAPEKLAQGIMRVLQDDSLRATVARGASEDAKRWSMDSRIKSIREFISSI